MGRLAVSTAALDKRDLPPRHKQLAQASGVGQVSCHAPPLHFDGDPEPVVPGKKATFDQLTLDLHSYTPRNDQLRAARLAR
jgi:hypothetical protein